MQLDVAIQHAEALANRIGSIETGHQRRRQILPGGSAATMKVGRYRNAQGCLIVRQSTWTDNRVVQISCHQMVIRMGLRFVIMLNRRRAVHVVVDGTQLDVAFHAVHLGRYHRSNSTQLINKNGLVLSCFAA